VLDLEWRLAQEAAFIGSEISHRRTLTSREIQTAVRLTLPGELSKHAVSEGVKAVTKYNSSCRDERSGHRLMSQMRAGLQWNVGAVRSFLRKQFAGRIGAGAPIYLSATLEYLVAEVLELAGNAAQDCNYVRITPRHLMLAVRNDEELDRLVQHCIIPAGGVIPHIHTTLIPKCSKPHEEESSSQEF